LKIQQADRYKYEMRHFGKSVEGFKIESGQCFENVKGFCDKYASLGRSVRVSLVLGLRTWGKSDLTFGYHYLVHDEDTGEYSDPQYGRYTFIELHSWSVKEYDKECVEFERSYDMHPAQEFAYHYIEKYKKQLTAVIKLIKTQGHCKLSDANIRARLTSEPEERIQPKFGRQEIELFRID
jgi:hypothetical protein